MAMVASCDGGVMQPLQDIRFLLQGLPFAQAAFGAICGSTIARLSGTATRASIATAVRAASCSDSAEAKSIETPVTSNASSHIDLLEEALAIVKLALACGDGKASATAVKARLREQGEIGRAMATRVGKLSKIRNAAAHPDFQIIDHLSSLAARSGNAACIASPDPAMSSHPMNLVR